MLPVTKEVDKIVAPFTKNILELARKNDVDFDYAGNKGDAKAEIKRTMSINNDAISDLLDGKKTKHGLFALAATGK